MATRTGVSFASYGSHDVRTDAPESHHPRARQLGEKFAGAAVTRENPVTNLLNRWNALAAHEKEDVASVIIATAITAVSAVAAVARTKKKVTKTATNVDKRAVKRAARKVLA